MHRSKVVGGTIAVFTALCMVLTMWIIHNSGLTQGATANGQWALGLAFIAVHAILVIFGLAIFAASHWFARVVCALMMLGAGLCSAWAIGNFLATEVISVNHARELAEKRADARASAVIELAKERQKTQAELAQGHLKYLHEATGQTKGRLSRRDYMQSGEKLITDLGKVEMPAPPEIKDEAPRLQTGWLATQIAARLGQDPTAMQASPSLMTALMLLLIECIGWPFASYFWNKTSPETGPAPAAPAQRLPAQEAAPAALDATEPVKALPAPLQSADVGQPEPPKPPHPSKAPAPVRIERRPVDEWAEAALKLIDFPVYQPGKRVGPLREKNSPKDAARRFALWMQAVGLAGPHSPTEVSTLYREFAEWDHRKAISYNTLASVLDRAPGVTKKNATLEDGTRAMRWIVAPRKFRPAKAQQQSEGSDPVEPTQAEPAEEVRPSRPFSGSSVVVMRPERGEPAWLHEQAKRLRRWRIEQRRKQRKARVRRAA